MASEWPLAGTTERARIALERVSQGSGPLPMLAADDEPTAR
jgi:hypothetical protein